MPLIVIVNGKFEGLRAKGGYHMEKLTITVPEMAEMLNICLPKAYELTRIEGFPCLRIVRKVLIPLEGLKEWVNSRKQGE